MTPSQVRKRIIPALAGNTCVVAHALRDWRDHPRSRGEYVWAGQRSWTAWGSSPLSRGIRPITDGPLDAGRIIPALAGNTTTAGARDREEWDHPRSRGEYRGVSVSPPMRSGSSPLSRGIRDRQHTAPLPARIIPALAGNTTWSRCSPTRGRDHPRSRGEYTDSF